MKFKILIILLLFALVTIFGCDKTTDGEEKKQAIRVAAPVWYSPDNLPAISEASKAWNKENKDFPVHVETLFGKRSSIFQKIVLGLTREDFADAVLVRNEWIGRLAADGLIRKITPENAAKIEANLLPALTGSVADESGLWAVPFDADAYVVWMRNDLIGPQIHITLRWNIERMPDYARNVTRIDSGKAQRYGFAFAAGENPTSAMAFLPWYLTFGGRLSDDSGHIRFDAKPAREAMEYLRLFVDDKTAPPAVGALETSNVFTGLAGGAYAMIVGGTWDRDMLQKQSRLSEDIIAMPIPGKGDNSGVTLIGGWSFVLAKSANVKAEDFVISLFDAKTQRSKLRQNSLLPVNRQVLRDAWFDENQDGPAFKQSLAHGRSLPLNPKAVKAVQQISKMLTEVFLDKKSPADAANDTADLFNAS